MDINKELHDKISQGKDIIEMLSLNLEYNFKNDQGETFLMCVLDASSLSDSSEFDYKATDNEGKSVFKVNQTRSPYIENFILSDFISNNEDDIVMSL